MRYSGYVVAGDISPQTKQTVWKVRVINPGNENHRQKLIVASTHEGITLSRGLNVNFEIGSVNGHNGQIHSRAVDVRLQ